MDWPAIDWWSQGREFVYFMAIWILSGISYSRWGGETKRLRAALKDRDLLIEHLRGQMNYYAFRAERGR
jgi:hypothetical protein